MGKESSDREIEEAMKKFNFDGDMSSFNRDEFNNAMNDLRN